MSDSPAAPWLLIAALTVLAGVIRVILAGKGLFADEMSTYWIITAHSADAGQPALHGLGGVISLVGHVYPGGATTEITPPMYFGLAWLTTQLGHSAELVRLPSLIAGIASVPVIYLLGLRTVKRAGALVAAALLALCPFMIYYSSEARAYSVMMLLVMVSTLSMLLAVDTGRRRWWALYAAASAGAMLSHYTSAFVLAAQGAWLLWAYPQARKHLILANLGAFVLFAPWIPGAIHDFQSPTLKILSKLSPFSLFDIRVSLEHWILGYPYSSVSLRDLPGWPALILLALSALITLGALGRIAIRLRNRAGAMRPGGRLTLVIALALSVPVLEAIVSTVGTHVFGGRNLAASTPAMFLLIGAALAAAGPRLRYVAGLLAITAFALGSAKMLEPKYERPDVQAGASFVLHNYRRGDVVIDETSALSPGPLSPLDTVLAPGIPVLRAGSPQEHDHPFNFFDPVVSLAAAVPKAVAAAHSNRIIIVANNFPPKSVLLGSLGSAKISGGTAAEQKVLANSATASAARAARNPLPRPYHLVAQRSWPGFPGVEVKVYAP